MLVLTCSCLEFLRGYDGFCQCFCHDCPDVMTVPGDDYHIPERICPCEFDMTDERCRRNEDWLKVCDLTEQIAQIATETYREDWD